MSQSGESHRAPTYADIEALPPGVVGEILAGALVVSPRPAVPHTMAASRLGSLLGPPFDLGLGGPGGWRIFNEPELRLGVDPAFHTVVPDLAGWHLAVMPERLDVAHISIVPQWVCEVVSPSTQLRDRLLKLPFYARAGVGHAWLLDPLAELLEVYALQGAGWRLAGTYGEDDTVSPEPFEAVPLALSWLWGRHPPAG